MLFLWVFFVFVFVLVFFFLLYHPSFLCPAFRNKRYLFKVCSKLYPKPVYKMSKITHIFSAHRFFWCASTPAPGLLLHPCLRQSGDLGCGSKLQNPHFVPTPSMGSKAFISISADVASHMLLVLWREACDASPHTSALLLT